MKNKELTFVDENSFDSEVENEHFSDSSEDENVDIVAESEDEDSHESESSSEENVSDEESGVEDEANSETYSVVTYDYSSYFENIQNANTFQSACLVAILILLGILMGFKKHD